MKDFSRESLEENRPPQEAHVTISFCLEQLYNDRKHRIGDEVVRNLTFEEMIGALLQARDLAEETLSPTWRALVKREPRLADLLKQVRAVQDDGGERFCANVVWYGHGERQGLKDILCRLVGWDAEKHYSPLLTSSAAYDLAYEKCYAALPDCRNCLCGGGVDNPNRSV